MKRAKSFTKRKPKFYDKLGFTEAQVETVARMTTEYLKYWTDQELKRLAIEENVPVCLSVGNNGYIVGKFHVEKLHGDCWRVYDQNKELVHDFGHKLSAIFYCLSDHKNKHSLANQILQRDNEVCKLQSDVDNYMYTIRISRKKNDYFKVDLANNRYIQATIQLKQASEELEKTLNTAKYLKV